MCVGEDVESFKLDDKIKSKVCDEYLGVNSANEGWCKRIVEK